MAHVIAFPTSFAKQHLYGKEVLMGNQDWSIIYDDPESCSPLPFSKKNWREIKLCGVGNKVILMEVSYLQIIIVAVPTPVSRIVPYEVNPPKCSYRTHHPIKARTRTTPLHIVQCTRYRTGMLLFSPTLVLLCL
jgi:hypothetical protein